MNREAFKLARDTLRLAVKDYAWRRVGPTFNDEPERKSYQYGPGKFEGEHWSIIHFYDAVMNGCGDEPLCNGDDVAADLLEVSDVEREAFGFNKDTTFVALWHHGNGFVSLQELTASEYDNLREEYSEPDSDDDDDDGPRMRCDSCEMLSINGVACHETGCRNSGARWDPESGTWIAQRTCFICGYTHDADSVCCDHAEYQTDADDDSEVQS